MAQVSFLWLCSEDIPPLFSEILTGTFGVFFAPLIWLSISLSWSQGTRSSPAHPAVAQVSEPHGPESLTCHPIHREEPLPHSNHSPTESHPCGCTS